MYLLHLLNTKVDCFLQGQSLLNAAPMVTKTLGSEVNNGAGQHVE